MLTWIAAINSAVLACVAYISVFMNRVELDEASIMAFSVMVISLLGSLITKLWLKKKWILISSVVFDLILVFYLYNPLQEQLSKSFLERIKIPEYHLLMFFYIYLIIFYIVLIKNNKSNPLVNK